MEYRGEMAFFDLQYVDLLKEYEGKLVIDWGGSARMWHQKATTEKPIVAIESKNQKPFVGFENLILSFDELKEVVENDTDYELWQAAMAAVYLIVDSNLEIDMSARPMAMTACWGVGLSTSLRAVTETTRE